MERKYHQSYVRRCESVMCCGYSTLNSFEDRIQTARRNRKSQKAVHLSLQEMLRSADILDIDILQLVKDVQ